MWYLIRDLGYDGQLITSCENEEDAISQLKEHIKKQPEIKTELNFTEPAIIIEGTIKARYDWPEEILR